MGSRGEGEVERGLEERVQEQSAMMPFEPKLTGCYDEAWLTLP